MNTETSAGAGPVDQRVRPAPGEIEAEVLRNLANNTRFEVEVLGACDGSMLAQKAACLEWLACGAEYQQALRRGTALKTGNLLVAQENMVKQIKFLMA